MQKKSNGGSKRDDFDSAPVTRTELRRGVIGKYARDAVNLNRFVELDSDIAREFPTSTAVNEALRLVMQLKQIGKVRKKSA